MVKLTRIYTRGGDKGETSLGDGARVAKHDPRVAAYGTVDEANATIGLARLHAPGALDDINARLAPLDSFVLPGGGPAAAALHLARTVSRRAEREITALAEAETINPEAVRYINRLSDLLFVLARHANDDGAKDVLWEPGANR